MIFLQTRSRSETYATADGLWVRAGEPGGLERPGPFTGGGTGFVRDRGPREREPRGAAPRDRRPDPGGMGRPVGPTCGAVGGPAARGLLGWDGGRGLRPRASHHRG